MGAIGCVGNGLFTSDPTLRRNLRCILLPSWKVPKKCTAFSKLQFLYFCFLHCQLQKELYLSQSTSPLCRPPASAATDRPGTNQLFLLLLLHPEPSLLHSESSLLSSLHSSAPFCQLGDCGKPAAAGGGRSAPRGAGGAAAPSFSAAPECHRAFSPIPHMGGIHPWGYRAKPR